MKLIVPTRNTRFLPNLTLDWLTTAIRSTREARRTFHLANLQENTTPCPISKNNSMSRSPVFISYCLWDSLPQSCENISAFVHDLSDRFP